jgi:two-component system, sensor histidine kinase
MSLARLLASVQPFVRLSEPRVLSEQLKLLLRNCTSPTVLGFLLASVMFFALRTHDNQYTMLAWWVCTAGWRLALSWIVIRLLLSPASFEHPRRTVLLVTLGNGVDMLCWGSLAWLALDHASLAGSVLVVAVLAGVAGNTMATLSPILPVFLGTMLVEVVVVLAKVWTMQDPAYQALGVAVVLYSLTLVGHAFNGHKLVLEAINLKYANDQLIGQLQAESELARQAQLAAEQANQDKSRFLAAASHDLRQPIHAQGLFLEVLADEALPPQSRRRALSNAQMAWRSSSDMLNTLLDFSRIEAGVLTLHVQAFRLQPLFHLIESELAPQADGKQLIYRTRETPLAVQSDPALLELIVRNLVSNAIRYTEHGGILMACRARGAQVHLEVWDTGVGIAPHHLEDIFKEFHQLGNPERDRRKGLGLGLAIVKGLVKELGHELQVHSVPGRGSCFRLIMPAATSPVVVASPEQRGGSQLLQPLGLKVLVIDDDELVLEAMTQLMAQWRCDCLVASSVDQARQLPQLPDLILSDYRLRDQMTGAQAVALLRAHWGQPVPAILLTGDTARERLREALSSGMPLLHKPVSPSQLHQQIRALVPGGRAA